MSYADSGRYTDSDLERRRRMAEAMLGASMGSEPIGSWTQGVNKLAQALIGGYKLHKIKGEEQAQSEAGYSALLDALSGLGSGGDAATSSSSAVPLGGGVGSDYAASGGQSYDVAQATEQIRQGAIKRGMDPDVVVRGFQAEGLKPNTYQSNVVKNGVREPSFGPAQLYTGGGLGNEFEKTTGLNLRDPKTVPQQIEFALDKLKQGGWGPWYGPTKQLGYGQWQGINRGQAGGAPQDMAGAALPNVQPVAAAPSPDVMKFLGGGGAQPQQAGLSIGPPTPPIPQPRPPMVPQPRPTPPTQPPAPMIGRSASPPVSAGTPPAVQPAAGPAMAMQRQPRGQITNDQAMAPQEFARQGQNYLRGIPSFPGQGAAPGVPQQAMQPQQPPQGLLGAIMGGGGSQGAQMGQGAPTASPVAGNDSRQRIAAILMNPQIPDGAKTVLLRQMMPQPRQPQNIMSGGPGTQFFDPNTHQMVGSVPLAPPEEPSGVREYEYARKQGFKGQLEDWKASQKGGMSLQVDPATGQVSLQTGGNIKPLTEAQSKDAVYATRAQGALEKLDKYGNALTDLGQSVASGAGTVGNYLKTPEYQQAEQAGREFLQAILRKDTGAAITAGEMDSYGKTYLPGPGDSPELLAQKQQSRTRALEALKAGMTPQAILNQERALKKTEEAAPAEGATPPHITNDAEFDALPSGAEFIAPDGSHRRKP